MKLILNNLVYNTENPVRIERLKGMGAVEFEEDIVVDGTDGLDNDDYDGEIINVEDLSKKELIELLEERGIEYKSNANKDELITLLKEAEEDLGE